jgi:hypothetical protein
VSAATHQSESAPAPLPALKLTVIERELLVSNVRGPSDPFALISGAGVACDEQGKISTTRINGRMQICTNILYIFIVTPFQRYLINKVNIEDSQILEIILIIRNFEFLRKHILLLNGETPHAKL